MIKNPLYQKDQVMRKAVIFSTVGAALLMSVSALLVLPSAEPVTLTSAATENEVTELFSESEALLTQTAESAEQQVTTVRKGSASDVFVDSEFADLKQTITDFKNYSVLQQFTEYRNYAEIPATGPEQEILLKDIRLITADAVESLNIRVQNWTSTVDRMREESAPVGESSDERIIRLQQEMNLPFPYRIGECALNEMNHETAWGCYTAGDDFYTVTLSGLAASDCNLRTTLAHEHHHYLQWVDGYFEGPNSKSTAWLEADARENEWKGGGC